MRTLPIALGLALAAAAAPAALATAPSHPANGPSSGDRPAPARPAARTLHLAQACVVADATAAGVDVHVLSANRHLRRALAGSREFTVAIGASTRVDLVGRARLRPDGTRAPRAGTTADLTAGVWVTVWTRAPRGTAAADLPAAVRIRSHGAVRRCAAFAPAPATPPAGTGGATL